MPDGGNRRLGRSDGKGNVVHRPGRDLTLSAPKSVSLAALVGGLPVGAARHDGVGGNVGGALVGDALGERDQPRLGGAVGGERGAALAEIGDV